MVRQWRHLRQATKVPEIGALDRLAMVDPPTFVTSVASVATVARFKVGVRSIVRGHAVHSEGGCWSSSRGALLPSTNLLIDQRLEGGFCIASAAAVAAWPQPLEVADRGRASPWQ